MKRRDRYVSARWRLARPPGRLAFDGFDRRAGGTSGRIGDPVEGDAERLSPEAAPGEPPGGSPLGAVTATVGLRPGRGLVPQPRRGFPEQPRDVVGRPTAACRAESPDHIGGYAEHLGHRLVGQPGGHSGGLADGGSLGSAPLGGFFVGTTRPAPPDTPPRPRPRPPPAPPRRRPRGSRRPDAARWRRSVSRLSGAAARTSRSATRYRGIHSRSSTDAVSAR